LNKGAGELPPRRYDIETDEEEIQTIADSISPGRDLLLRAESGIDPDHRRKSYRP
jgi:hypothetical protein